MVQKTYWVYIINHDHNIVEIYRYWLRVAKDGKMFRLKKSRF